MKIVINDYFGGYFGLSYEAMSLYLATKSKTAYFYVDLSPRINGDGTRKFKRVPLSDIPVVSKNIHYVYCTTEDQGEELNHFPANIFHDRDVDRTDPDLISVIEFLGSDKASGRYASLSVKEIEDGTIYRLNTYNGCEEIEYRDNLGWKIADSHEQSTQVDPKLLKMVYNNITKGELS